MSTAMYPNPDRSRGFTLIELLVSITILGLISTVAFAGFRLGMDSWTRGSSVIAQQELRRSAWRVLQGQLAQSVPVGQLVKVGRRYLDFNGDSTRIRFVAPMSRAASEGGLYVFELEIVDRAEQSYLVVRYHPHRAVDEQWQEVTLITLQGSARWDYYGAVRRSMRPEWYDSWQRATRLPEVVRLQAGDREWHIPIRLGGVDRRV